MPTDARRANIKALIPGSGVEGTEPVVPPVVPPVVEVHPVDEVPPVVVVLPHVVPPVVPPVVDVPPQVVPPVVVVPPQVVPPVVLQIGLLGQAGVGHVIIGQTGVGRVGQLITGVGQTGVGRVGQEITEQIGVDSVGQVVTLHTGVGCGQTAGVAQIGTTGVEHLTVGVRQDRMDDNGLEHCDVTVRVGPQTELRILVLAWAMDGVAIARATPNVIIAGLKWFFIYFR